MKLPGTFKHVLILPLCWALLAGYWSFPVWKYSGASYTFVGKSVLDALWSPGITCDVMGFVASVLEVTAVAIMLDYLRVPKWVYLFATLPPAYTFISYAVTSRGEFVAHFRGDIGGLALYGSWSFYFTGLLALVAFLLLHVSSKLRARPA
jgi:hypothetical protein